MYLMTRRPLFCACGLYNDLRKKCLNKILTCNVCIDQSSTCDDDSACKLAAYVVMKYKHVKLLSCQAKDGQGEGRGESTGGSLEAVHQLLLKDQFT